MQLISPRSQILRHLIKLPESLTIAFTWNRCDWSTEPRWEAQRLKQRRARASSPQAMQLANTHRPAPTARMHRLNGPYQAQQQGRQFIPRHKSPKPVIKVCSQPARAQVLEAIETKKHKIAIDLDSSDPDLDLNARARKLGPVVPNPTLSNSSTFNQAHGHLHQSSASQTVFPSRTAAQNPAVRLLEARERLAAEAEEEFANVGKKGAAGRKFMDVYTIRQVLQMREKGISSQEIEGKLGLRKGTVGVLGGKGVVSLTAVA